MDAKQIKALKNAARSMNMLIARVAMAQLSSQDVIKIHEMHLTKLKKLIEWVEYPELHQNEKWED